MRPPTATQRAHNSYQLKISDNIVHAYFLSNAVGTITNCPSPPFSFTDIVFVISGLPAFNATFVKNSVSVSSNSGKSLYHQNLAGPNNIASANFSCAFKTRSTWTSYFTRHSFLLLSQDPLQTHTHKQTVTVRKSCTLLENFNHPFNTNQACYSFPSFTRTLNWAYILKAKEKKFYHNFRVSSQK